MLILLACSFSFSLFFFSFQKVLLAIACFNLNNKENVIVDIHFTKENLQTNIQIY